MSYAKATTVPPQRSRAELETILQKYGCAAFGFATDGDLATVQFIARGRHVRYRVAVPPLEHFLYDGGARRRTPVQVRNARDAEERRLWRALLLCIKGKLEAVESGIVAFEDEFLANVLLPDGSTVASTIQTQIDDAYSDGQMPKLLGA